MKVLIDADACPRGVMGIIKRLQPEHGYQILTVSSFNHFYADENHLIVGDEDQAADIALLNRAEKGDIVVTQDWGVAAVACGKGAATIDPKGRIFNPETIDFLLEERYMKAEYRRRGGRTRGPAARNKKDDQRFLEAFKRLLTNKLN
jgi:hypothetical protein